MHLKPLHKTILWCLIMAAIFTLALVRSEKILPVLKLTSSDAEHIYVFASIVILTRFTFPNWRLLNIMLITFCFGMAIEYIQELFTEGLRRFYWIDVINNILGIGTGALFIIIKETVKFPKPK